MGVWYDEGGVIAVLTALGLTVLIGMVGLAVDISMWYRTDRALQNAADAAVIAAALREVYDWSGRYRRFWRRRLDALGELLEEQP